MGSPPTNVDRTLADADEVHSQWDSKQTSHSKCRAGTAANRRTPYIPLKKPVLESAAYAEGCNVVTGLKLKGSTFADGVFGRECVQESMGVIDTARDIARQYFDKQSLGRRRE